MVNSYFIYTTMQAVKILSISQSTVLRYSKKILNKTAGRDKKPWLSHDDIVLLQDYIEKKKHYGNDLIGKKINFLTVLNIQDSNSKKSCGIIYKCRCDCGNIHNVKRTNLLRNQVKSCGKCFIKTNKYDLSGDYGICYTKNGNFFIFDKEDFDKLKNYTWHISSNGYATAYIPYKPFNIAAHTVVMEKNDTLFVDHINHNRTDNRKQNLRYCTSRQNNLNIKKKGYTITKCGKYQVYMAINGKQTYIGTFDTEEAAIKARYEYSDPERRVYDCNLQNQ